MASRSLRAALASAAVLISGRVATGQMTDGGVGRTIATRTAETIHVDGWLDESLSRDWDGIWNAVARITDEGWTVEIAIPFKTLRFKPGQATWGFNIERQIKRRQELDRWTAARQNVWISNLAEAGQLDGLAGVRQGLGLDVRPYGSAAVAGGSGDATGGVDLFKNLTSSVNAAVSVNTDFAETEADLRQVNLTRFPLFFPEKRSFFLEGAGVFDVAGLINTIDLRPFFSRRVGLVGDVAVPVRLGLKLTGRQADYNVGVLDVETGALTDAPGCRAGSAGSSSRATICS